MSTAQASAFRRSSTTKLRTLNWPRNERLPLHATKKSKPTKGRRGELPAIAELQEAAELLDRAGTRWASVGGQIANLYRATPRRTVDFDFLVTTFDGLLDVLRAAGFKITSGDERARDPWLIRAKRGGTKFDFSLAELDFQRAAIARAELNGGVATREDIIILKIIAWRPQDRDDVASILATQAPVEFVYVRRWCEALDPDNREYSDRLAAALDQHRLSNGEPGLKR